METSSLIVGAAGLMGRAGWTDGPASSGAVTDASAASARFDSTASATNKTRIAVNYPALKSEACKSLY